LKRVAFIDHQGTKILSLDFTGCELEQIVVVVQEAKRVIAAEPKNSLLTLTNVADAHTNAAVTLVMKEFTAHNKPFVKAAAVIGLDGFRRFVFEAVIKFSGRNLVVFDDLEKAKDWLAEQQAAKGA
jgi:hypothetical protein